MIMTHKITMDLMTAENMPKIQAVQDDRYTRKLELTLYSGGEIWNIPELTSVMIRYTRPDGGSGAYNVLRDGRDAWEAEGNVLTVLLAPEVLCAAGLTAVTISMLNGDTQISSFAVGIQVKPSAAAMVPEKGNTVHVMTVGSVEALEATQAPTARIEGTMEHPVLHLGIPVGDLLDAERVITMEEISGGYWDTKGVWTPAEGIWVKQTNLIPVQPGEGFLYTGYGMDNIASAVWYDAAENILAYEQYDVKEGVRAIIVPDNAVYVRFYSHSYDGSGTVILEVTHLPKGDRRKVKIESKTGGYWDIDGGWTEAKGGSKRTNPILVHGDDHFCYIGYGRWMTVSVIWYDADGGIVAVEQHCEEVNNRPINAEILPPRDAVYVRFCSYCDEGVDNVVLGVSIATDSQRMDWFKKSNVLFGKKYVACGDSFTAGDFTNASDGEEYWDPVRKTNKTYPWWIADRNGMVLINEAICGTTMYNNGSENAFSVSRYIQVPEDADYITLCFGLNETGAALGSLSDTTNATVMGAWNLVLEHLITKAPFAKIGILIPDAWCTEEMRDAIVSVAQYWGIPWLDLKGDPKVPMMIGGRYESVNQTAVAVRNQAFQMTAEDAHPNLRAHEYRSTVIEHFRRSL